MADYAAYISVSHSNTFWFTNSCNNDMMFYSETSNQRIIFGTQSNNAAMFIVDSNYTRHSGDVYIDSNIYLNKSFNMRGIRLLPYNTSTPYNISGVVSTLYGFSNETNNMISLFGNHVRICNASNNEIARFTSNRYFGINDSNPSDLLHILADVNNLGITLEGASNGITPSLKFLPLNGTQKALIGISGSNTALCTSAMSNDLVLRAESQNVHICVNNGASILTVTSNSNVGVGTAAPGAKMHIVGGTATKKLQFDSVSGNRAIVLFEQADNDHEYYGFGINSGTLRFQVPTSGSRFSFFSGASSTTSTEVMRLGGAGNLVVGGGYSTSYNLDVNGTGLIKSTLVVNSNIGVGLATAPSSLLHMTSNASNYVTFTNASNTLGGQVGLENTVNGGCNMLVWNVANAGIRFGANNTEAMRINSNGQIGIGTTAPVTKLHISDFNNSNVFMRLSASNNALHSDICIAYNTNDFLTNSLKGDLCIKNTTGSNILFGYGTTNVMTLNSNGRIGIGTTSPAYTLDVNGNGRIGSNLLIQNSSTTNAAQLQFAASNSTLNSSIYLDSGGNLNIYNSGGGISSCNISFYTANTGPAMTINSNKNVGIGTSTPGYTLDVNGTMQASNLQVNNYSTTSSITSPNGDGGGTVTGSSILRNVIKGIVYGTVTFTINTTIAQGRWIGGVVNHSMNTTNYIVYASPSGSTLVPTVANLTSTTFTMYCANPFVGAQPAGSYTFGIQIILY